jgi:hypothetical protein
LAPLTAGEDDDAVDVVIALDSGGDGEGEADGHRGGSADRSGVGADPVTAGAGARTPDPRDGLPRPAPSVVPLVRAVPAVPAAPARAAGSVLVLTPTTPPMAAVRPTAHDDRAPRNLLGWFSPDRRQRVGAGMVAAGVVVAVALALQLVDGGRSDEVQLGNSTGTETSTVAPPAAVAGDGSELQVRRAPVGELPVPVEDQPTTTHETVHRAGNEPHAVAGTATTRPVARVVTPTSASPSPTPSPSTSSPSPSASPTVSPSSPTPSGSPTVSVSGGTGTASPSSLPTSSVSGSPSGSSPGSGTGGLSGSGVVTSFDTGTSGLLGAGTTTAGSQTPS